MNSKNIYYLSMLTRLLNLCTTNEQVYALLTAFSDILTDLAARKLVCDAYVVLLQEKSEGITTNALKVKTDVAINYGVACSLVSAYGASIDDDKLKNIKLFNFSNLLKSKIEELKSSIVTILGIIDVNKTALLPFGISPAFILKLKPLK